MAEVTTSPELSLRERKRLRTMGTIQEAALRLFADQGYDATTVEQIAAAADVSPATFFRYFPSKESVIKSDEFDDLMLETLRSRPPEEDIFTAMRAVVEVMSPHLEAAKDSLLVRARLLFDAPGLRGLMWDAAVANTANIGNEISRRVGLPTTDVRVRAQAAALAGASIAAMTTWLESAGTASLADLFSQAFDGLEGHITPD